DKVTVAYSYSDFPENTDEKDALNEILKESHQQGLRYISDRDSRPMGSAHILGHLWDNGGSASSELDRLLELRGVAIENFSIDNIRRGEPNSVLEDVFVPLYFLHRYQTEAAVKSIGGLNYNYAVKGDGQTVVETLPARDQKEAVKSVLQTLDATVIAIPREKLTLFPPRAIGHGRTRESIDGKTGVAFDALSATETAADMTLGFLFHPERASRLIQQKSLDPSQMGLKELFDAVIEGTINNSHKDSYHQAVQNTINYRVLMHLMNLAAHKDVHPRVNALANASLLELQSRLKSSGDPDAREMARRIDDFNEDRDEFKVITSPKIPDGSPIGMACSQ
ncbi:MAG: zinc-dependent metalloprotease, partial [Muriicola sp.]|nr:zinc-dependent metalloprotease [Muriicola sp.]